MEGNKEVQKEVCINIGLCNYWYLVVVLWNVKNVLVGIICLSQNIVLWCDIVGQVYVLEDCCLYCGVCLLMGWNLGDYVVCWYYGVEVNGQGMVMSVFVVDVCFMEGKICVCSYLVQECVGVIFFWFGDKVLLEFDDVVGMLWLFEELISDEYSYFFCFVYWNVNYCYVIDNVMDLMYGVYLYVVLYLMVSGEKKVVMEVVEIDYGIMFQKIGQCGVNFDWIEFGEIGMMWLCLLILY